MPKDVNFMVGGEAGQGVQSVGFILAKAFARGGYHIFAEQDYENRVRGGHNFFRVRISDREVLAISQEMGILIAMNRETIELHKDEVKSDGVIIFDLEQTGVDTQGDSHFGVPLSRLAGEAGQNKLMTNTVAVGVAAGLMDYDFDLLAMILQEEFASHGSQVSEGNVAAARAGFGYAQEHWKRKLTQTLQPMAGAIRRMLLHGNEAIALGAITGGCKFIAGYPMTPATPILEYMADKGRDFNMIALHVEDEISAINMAVGAGYTGVRSMVATSGGGFCLMVEGLALAGMTETPIVIVLGQRPGPATGMPTRTEQGELEFALHAGHGEFPRVVLAPSTVGEAFYATIKAFNLAEKYQTPVIMLTDHHLATSYSTVERFDLKQVRIDRSVLLSDEEASRLTNYKRHQVTESGVSPRALPGQNKALVVTDSDEHDEAGHLIEDSEIRNQQNLKRLRKLNVLKAEINSPKLHKVPDAEFILIGWGSTYGAIKEAAEILQKDGIPANILHFSEIWPFPAEAVASLLNNSIKSIVIESNASAQMAQLIRHETGLKVYGNILKFDGHPFSPGEIVVRLRKEVL